MSEKKELNQEELEKVSGGLSERDFAKYYCIVESSKKIGRGEAGGSDIIGPYNTMEEAKQGGLDWAIEYTSKGYYNISYQPVLMLYGHVLESYTKYKYYPRTASI